LSCGFNWSSQHLNLLKKSHETVYRSLCVQTRAVLKTELQDCLRIPRAIRRSRHETQKGLKLHKIKDAIPISERPPEVEDRAASGHWQGYARKGRKQGHTKRHHGPYQTGTQAAQGVVSVACMGSWAPQVHHRHKDRRLFL
jgi:IS30 family transposase